MIGREKKKVIAREWNAWTAPSLYGHKHNRVLRENIVTIAETLLTMKKSQLEKVAEGNNPSIPWIIARAILNAGKWGDYTALDKILDRIIGKANQPISVLPTSNLEDPNKILTFQQFCERAGYPTPFDKQIEMMNFVIFDDKALARLLLGSRNYGKTDYAVILGMAYKIYLDRQWTFLLVTKSTERNAAIVDEVGKAAAANGVRFEKNNASTLRVEGLKGKDHSLASITVGTSSIRGRHPKQIIMDDPVTEDDVSEATRKKVQRVYNELNKLTPNIAVIGQPVHKFDLFETLRPLVKRMEVPHGTIPQLDHDLEAQRLAGVSEESISASYHLKVISESGFPFEKIKYIDTFPNTPSVAFIDPSHEGGDYTALSIITGYFDGIAVKGKVWKRAWYDCVDEMAEACAKAKVQKLCIETNALGEQPVRMLREVTFDIGVVGKRSTQSKHSRIMAAGPYASQIFIAKDSDRKYIDQVIKYEYGAEPDDAPDSLATGLEWIGLIKGK